MIGNTACNQRIQYSGAERAHSEREQIDRLHRPPGRQYILSVLTSYRASETTLINGRAGAHFNFNVNVNGNN